MKYCISVDWFQYYCTNDYRTKLVMGTFFQGAHKYKTGEYIIYKVDECKEFHSLYRDSFCIKMKNQSLVNIYMTPKMSALNPSSVSIKVCNRLLYKVDWSWFLHDIIEALNFTIRNITRIDICMDFQKFAYKDMTPSEFIHHYLQDQSVATEDTFIREGSNNFCIYGGKQLIPENEDDELTDSTPVNVTSNFEYIRFGSRNSGVCTYLYNKSKELRDKHSKPWIKDRWNECGLFENDGDIYRLEFSISAKGMCLKKADRKKGMVAPLAKQCHYLCKDDVETQRNLERIFVSYQSKYFAFRLVGKQKYRKDMKPIVLFDYDIQPTMLPCYYNTKLNQGKAEHNAAVCLQRLQWQCKDLSGEQYATLYKAQQLLESLSVSIRELNRKDAKSPVYLKRVIDQDLIFNYREVKIAIDEAIADMALMQQNLDDLREITPHELDLIFENEEDNDIR